MKEFIAIILVILLVVAGISWFGFGIFYLSNFGDNEQQTRYFKCLDRTEKQTCDKIFYKYQLK